MRRENDFGRAIADISEARLVLSIPCRRNLP